MATTRRHAIQGRMTPVFVESAFRTEHLEDRILLAATIFLDFANFQTQLNAAAADAGVPLFTDSSEVSEVQNAVIARVKKAYGSWSVNFEATDPGGDYETITFGTTEATIFGTGATGNRVGTADPAHAVYNAVDILNNRDDDSVHVFTENFGVFIEDPNVGREEQKEQLIAALANVAIHELGHNFGLVHADSYGDASIDPTDTERKQNTHYMGSGTATGMNNNEYEGDLSFSAFSQLKLSYATAIGSSTPIDATAANDHGSMATAMELDGSGGFALTDDIGVVEGERYYKFSGEAGRTVTIAVASLEDVTLNLQGDEVDTKITLFRADGTTVVQEAASTAYGETTFGSGSSGSADPMMLNVELPASETYFIRVEKEGSGSGLFTLFTTASGAVIDPDEECLVVRGLNAVADVIDITTVGTNIAVDVNGTVQAFAASSFESICVFGYSGNDTITVDSSVYKPAKIDGGLGDDTISGGSGDDEIKGGDGNDSIHGYDGSDELFGGLGDDSIFAGKKDDTIFGDAGKDLLSGGQDDDEIHGGTGDDVIAGWSGNDTLTGGEGDDFIGGDDWVGNPGAQTGTDSIHGDDGDDVLVGGPMVDTIFGGDGEDVLWSGDEVASGESESLDGEADCDIVDGVADGDCPQIQIDDVTVIEDDGMNGSTVFVTVSLSDLSTSDVTVDYSTADGTATSGTDYTAASGNITIYAGTLSASIPVQLGLDTAVEGDETVLVILTNATDASISDPQGVVTIQDNDFPPPEISVSNASSDEVNGTIDFTVSLSASSTSSIDVDYAVTDITATDGMDYTAASGTLTIPAGSISEMLSFSLIDDSEFEGDETFTVDLTNPVNASILDGQGVGTILDDEQEPTISIDDVSVDEFELTASFLVSLSNSSGQSVTVDYSTSDGSATDVLDYTGVATTTLTFLPGEYTQSIDITLVDDFDFEGDETFTVNLSNPVNASILDGQGTGTILDDEQQPTLSIDDIFVDEFESTASFQVYLSSPSGQTITVDYSTADGSASDGLDYTGVTTTTLTFLPGEYAQWVDVTILDDSEFEGDETFTVDLSNPVNATITYSQGTATIYDDDGMPLTAATQVQVGSDQQRAALTEEMLNPIVDAAIENWVLTDPHAAAALQNIRFAIRDLPDLRLGMAFSNLVAIDIDAAGHGWFIDVTPADNAEFAERNTGEVQGGIEGRPAGRMDLLSVVIHELGHILGFDDLRDSSNFNDVMYHTLDVGVRRVKYLPIAAPIRSQADIANSPSIERLDLADAAFANARGDHLIYDGAPTVSPEFTFEQTAYSGSVPPPNTYLLGESGRLQFALEADLGLSLQL